MDAIGDVLAHFIGQEIRGCGGEQKAFDIDIAANGLSLKLHAIRCCEGSTPDLKPGVSHDVEEAQIEFASLQERARVLGLSM